MALKASDVIVAWLSRNIDIWGGDCEILTVVFRA